MSSTPFPAPRDDPAPAASPFRRVRALVVVLLMIVAGIGVELARRAIFGPGDNDWSDAGASLAFQVGLAALLVFYLRGRGVRVTRLIGGAPRGWRAWGLAAVAAPLLVLSLGTAALQFSLLATLAPQWARALGDTPDPAQASAGLIVLQALAGVAAAVMEEMLFRGVLFTRWEQRWGPWRAAVVSSLAFGVLHLDLLGAFVFGLAMCCIYVRTRSLLVPMLAHALNNAVIALSDLGSTTGPVPNASADLHPDWGSAALALALALPLLVWFFRACPPRQNWTLPYYDRLRKSREDSGIVEGSHGGTE